MNRIDNTSQGLHDQNLYAFMPIFWAGGLTPELPAQTFITSEETVAN